MLLLEELASPVYRSPDVVKAERGVKDVGEGSNNAQRRQNVKSENHLLVNEHGKNNKCAKAKTDVKTKSESNAICICNDEKKEEEQHRLMYYIE